MWCTISCVQGKRRGVNVYHPHSWAIAKQLCIDILIGIHPNGAANYVYVTVFDHVGHVLNATGLHTVFDVENWYDKRVGVSKVTEYSDCDGRWYNVRVETASYTICSGDVGVHIMVRGEPIKTGSIYTAITHYMEEFRKRIGGM
jgi:hypothetical protein